MKNKISIICSIALGIAFTAPSTSAADVTVYDNANIIVSFTQAAIKHGRVIVDGQKIQCVGSKADCPLKAGSKTLDYSQQWIMPSLVDSHVHYSQNGWIDSRPGVVNVRDRYPYEPLMAELKRKPQRWHESHLCTGISASYDAAGYPYVLELNKLDANAPQVLAVGPAFTPMQGKFASLPAEQFIVTMDSEEKIIATIKYLSSLNATGLKVAIFPLPEPLYSTMIENLQVVITEAKKHNLEVAVHARGLKEAKLAMKAGAKRLLHSVGDQAIDDEFIHLAKSNEVFYTPTLMVARGYARLNKAMMTGQAMELPNVMGCVDQQVANKYVATADILPAAEQDKNRASEAWKKYEEEEQLVADNLLKVHKAGIKIAFGTDSGNPGSPHGGTAYDELLGMQNAGLPTAAVWQMATSNAAQSIGLENELGSLAKGKRADFLILDKDPRVAIENFQSLHTVVHLGVSNKQKSLRKTITRTEKPRGH